MENLDSVEFYHGQKLIAAVNSSMIPVPGDQINIRKKAWDIVAVSFAVDYADDITDCRMRCNVEIEPYEKRKND